MIVGLATSVGHCCWCTEEFDLDSHGPYSRVAPWFVTGAMFKEPAIITSVSALKSHAQHELLCICCHLGLCAAAAAAPVPSSKSSPLCHTGVLSQFFRMGFFLIKHTISSPCVSGIVCTHLFSFQRCSLKCLHNKIIDYVHIVLGP